MLELAEVVGLEEHLTVPSRNQPLLVDLWIAIKRSSVGLEWERQFLKVAQNSNSTLSTTGAFEAVPFTERRGWIVARCVDGSAMTPTAVEKLTRALVAEANERVATPTVNTMTAHPQTAPQESWAKRVGTVIADGTGLTLGSWLAPRASRDIDIASG